MKSVPLTPDSAAIGLSVLCTFHCLALPLLVTLLPALTGTVIGDEVFHRWMLLAVLPTSLFAFTLGCRKHGRWSIAAIGASGLVLLAFTAIWGHDLFGETGEKIMTVLGASVIALGHVRNQALCKITRCHC